jgi:putative transcriptional regulator
MSLTDLSEAVGITLANLSILKTGKARAIRFTTLESICKVLDCQPGDILSFEPDSNDVAEVSKSFSPGEQPMRRVGGRRS